MHFIAMTSLRRHLSTLNAVQRIKITYPVMSNILLFVFRRQKPAHMPLFTLNCVQCIVTSVLRNQQYTLGVISLLIVKKVLSIRDDLAAVLF